MWTELQELVVAVILLDSIFKISDFMESKIN